MADCTLVLYSTGHTGNYIRRADRLPSTLAEIHFVCNLSIVYRGTMDGSSSYRRIYNMEYYDNKPKYHVTAKSLAPYLAHFRLQLVSVPGVVGRSCV